MFHISGSADHLDIVSPMPRGSRFLFALLALIPLLAPYELLLRVRWTEYLNPFFLLAAIISAGAVAVSGFLIFAAVAGLSTRMTFDAARSTFAYAAVAPAVRRHIRVYPLSSLEGVHVRTHEWSDGAPSYSLLIKMSDGTTFDSASSRSREYAEEGKARVEAFLQRKQDSRPLP